MELSWWGKETKKNSCISATLITIALSNLSLCCALCLVTQSCLTLCDPVGILQARVLEQVAMPSSGGSSQHKDQIQSPVLQVDSLLSEPPRKQVIISRSNYGHEFEQTPGGSKELGSRACCSPWGWKELDTSKELATEQEAAIAKSSS